MYSEFKDGGGETLDLEEIGRMSRLSVDRSLENVRLAIERELEERKLEMYEVGLLWAGGGGDGW